MPFSRLVLAIVLCSTKTADVRPVFERLFRKFGMPQSIQCDNGIPFVAVRARAGLSALSAWWVSLGISIVRSRRSCPQDNGAHERMHRDLSAEMQDAPAATSALQQRLLDKWKQEFNHVRPHQALGGKTPAEVYSGTLRAQSPTPPAISGRVQSEYRVHSNGCFYVRKQWYFLSLSLSGFNVGLERLDALNVRVWFYGIDLGTVEIEPTVDDSVYLGATRRGQRKVA